MKSFEYMQPDTLKAASKFLVKNSEAFPYAGGTDLLGLMKDDILSPRHLVNLKKLNNLDHIKYDSKDGLKIGALTKLSEIENSSIVKEKFTALYEAVTEIATPQLRNVGTIGGNICQRPRCFYFRGDYDCIRKGGDACFAITGNNKYHCIVGGDSCYIVHPSDTAVALIALDAKFKIFNGIDEKIIPANEFFVLPKINDQKENILNNGDILLEIILPANDKKNISKYIKVKERGAWDFALVSIAGVFEIDGKNIKKGKLAFGGVAPIPWEEEKVNKQLHNFLINDANIKNLSAMAFTDSEPLEMNYYKIKLAKNLINKILIEIIDT